MAIVVESSSSNTGSALGSTGLAINKPTGLAVGDLMIAAFVATENGSISSVSCTGWTSIVTKVNTQVGGGVWFFTTATFYKVADSSDVAASTFIFKSSSSNTNGFYGGIVRLSGASTFQLTAIDAANSNASSTALSLSTSLTPTVNNSLLVMIILGASTSASATTVSGYTIDGTNPTWTEAFDITGSLPANPRVTLSLATATQATATAITTSSATFSGSLTAHYAALVKVAPIVNASISPNVISTTLGVQAPVTSGSAPITVDVVSLTATPQAASVIAQAPKWNNVDKSTLSSINNIDKS